MTNSIRKGPEIMFCSSIIRKTAAIAFAFLLTAALFTGCGSEEEKKETPVEEIEIKIEKKENEHLVMGKAAYAIKDYEAAVMHFAIASQEGDAEAQYLLARCYLDEKGVEEDEHEILKWLGRSADQGYAKAQFILGLLKKEKEDLSEADDLIEKAVPGLRKAADQGDADAMFLLATAYIDALGVEENEEEGMKLLRKAAEKGDENAIRLLKDY